MFLLHSDICINQTWIPFWQCGFLSGISSSSFWSFHARILFSENGLLGVSSMFQTDWMFFLQCGFLYVSSKFQTHWSMPTCNTCECCFSPLQEARRWTLKCPELLKHAWHKSHLNGFSTVGSYVTLQSSRLTEDCRRISHLNVFSPLWIRTHVRVSSKFQTHRSLSDMYQTCMVFGSPLWDLRWVFKYPASLKHHSWHKSQLNVFLHCGLLTDTSKFQTHWSLPEKVTLE